MFRRLLVLALLAIAASMAAWLAATPVEGMALPGPAGPAAASLPEDEVSRQSCSYEGKTYHYDLYLPTGYDAAGDSRFPVIFIASPGGEATMANAEGWIRSQRWIAVMLVEARNGPADVNNENFLCAHDDVLQRVRVRENMKFATGVSGAARMSARFVTFRPGFRGLILQAAGMCSDYGFCDQIEWFLGHKSNLYTFATFGEDDFNLWELNHLQAMIPAQRFNHEIFSGGHEPAPVDTLDRAFSWLMANIREDEFAVMGKIKISDRSLGAADLLSGVTISASSGASTTTGDPWWTWHDSEGGYYYTRYSLSVMGGGNHALSASKQGYLFMPDSRTVGVPPEGWDQDFEMQLPAEPVSVTVPVAGSTSSAFSLTYTATQGLPTTLDFPAAAVSLAATVNSLTVVLTPTVATAGAGQVFAGHAFDLALYPDGHEQPGLTFNKPVTASIAYSSADVRMVSDLSQLALWHWTGTGWSEAVATCSPPSAVQHEFANRVIRVPFCRPGRYALFGPTIQVFLPLVLRY